MELVNEKMKIITWENGGKQDRLQRDAGPG